MRSLRAAMELAGKCHLAWLDWEKDALITGGYEVAHDTGRWWDAMLRLEATTGFAIPEAAEEAMLANLKLMLDNPLGVLMNSTASEWTRAKAVFNPHNFREGLLALAALVRYRNDAWAREAGHRLVDTLDRGSRQACPGMTRPSAQGVRWRLCWNFTKPRTTSWLSM